ncbi:thiaminase II [Nonomuraea phyllanthi]|uniref:Aminopyrimidine aminohydrolase n=1 Tax=Nonomuraea phyllanthi TaxID=2219224 RepID=A0A5C4WP16_9ACTN|nr:thiaminase II [Nonomuraea phyllanthi]KAB8195403.1 thiaminase II [Nonomuraea phyllanthi]QFY10462.1 thiaminase II [Nonomuraea phyllanthi]
MTFCEKTWARTAALLDAIHTHPFNAALGEGTLDRDRFAFYLVQDGRYLVAYAKVLATASARATDPADAAFFAQSAHTALVVERGLHAGYLGEFGLTAEQTGQIATSPTCLAYSSYLQAAALSAPLPVLAAAVLPCFWVYQDVGTALLARTSGAADHPYRTWISTYADPGFAASVEQAKAVVDRLAELADPGTRQAMEEAFCRATEYEWMFWDSAWRMESWPTARWLT